MRSPEVQHERRALPHEDHIRQTARSAFESVHVPQGDPPVSTKVRTALIGCGHLGVCVHLPTLDRLPGVGVVALADSNAASLRAASAIAPEAATFTDYRELLARHEVDAVIVAVPTHLHARVAMDVLAARKHLYLEKPLAGTVAEGRQLVDCWRESGRVGIIGFNYRFSPLFLRLRDRIARGTVGDVVAVRTMFASAPADLPDWKTRRTTGGGALMDLGVHHVDLVRFLLQRDVRSVGAQLHSVHSDDDRVSLDLHFDGGVVVQCLFAFGAVDEDRVEVYGHRGKLTVDRYHSVDVEFRPAGVGSSRAARLGLGWRGPSWRGLFDSPVLIQRLRAPTAEPSFQASLASFIAAAAVGRQSSPDLTDGLKALEVLDAAAQSAVERRRITIGVRQNASPPGQPAF